MSAGIYYVNYRSKDKITERLDKLLFYIEDFQRPYMGGEKPVDRHH